MNLINKKLLQQRLHSFEFPNPEKLTQSKLLLERWVKALKDSDLEGTKEKSVQGKFLSTFFEDILGYSDVTTGNEEWTLIQHPRIENDSKEPDGSLGWFTKDKKVTRAVIELKDAKAQLDKKQNRGSEKLTPIEQAYLYATKYEGCNWIIVSNFKEIRLYNKHRTQEYYEKFDVIDLVQDTELKRFYFLLSKENLISKEKESVIDILAKDTTEAEQDITKKFYSEFREVRLKLLGHLSDNNPQFEKEILLEKTQKLLDRFIFTLFCEDTSTLLPLNLVKNTYERAINSLSPSDERVWTEFKGLFLAIDKGNDRVKPPINAYNGGLFAFDEELDTLSIKDDFWANLMHLTEYDFETDLNVNILGHIFEQSISDLESLKSELRGEEQDKKKSKRKKDGIFYTPEYITRYIVENTVGKYLEEHPDKLETIKILDPACGSGAFLNQAHSFLIKEYTNRYEAKINEKLEKGESITLFDYNPAENNRNILLNNLYGVDLNRESVEITKLALWLKTARATEPLQNLDKNIKRGNSLIDDPEIAGRKAFNWNTEYNEIMNSGGFDVIIGNPPYVGQRGNADVFKPFQNGKWKWFYERKQDLYYYFLALSVQLLKPNGYLGVIVPQYWLTAYAARNLRKYLSEHCDLISILDLSRNKVFDDASINSSVFIFKKQKSSTNIRIEEQVDLVKKNHYYSYINNSELNGDSWDVFKNSQYVELRNKVGIIELGLISSINPGFISGADKVTDKYLRDYPELDAKKGDGVLVLNKKEYFDLNLDENSKYILKPFYKNSTVKRYYYDENLHEWIIRGNLIDKLENYPQLKRHLEKVKPILEGRAVNFALKKAFAQGKWWYLTMSKPNLDFEGEKILFPYRSESANFVYSNKPFYSSFDVFYLTDLRKDFNYKYILGILNSKLMRYFFKRNMKMKGKVMEFYAEPMNKIPIPTIDLSEQKSIEILVTQIEELTAKQWSFLTSLNNFLNNEFGFILDISYLRSLNNLGWNELIELLDKRKVKLDINKKEELFSWFRVKQAELNELQTKIQNLDAQIDRSVYKLYGLTEEEIKIIEDSLIIK